MRINLPNLWKVIIFILKIHIGHINSFHIIYHTSSGLDDNYLLKP